MLVEQRAGYCAEHRLERRAKRAVRDRQIKQGSPWRWVYKTRRWQGLRRQVLAEQPWCQVDGCFELSRDVDHIVSLQDGGPPFDRANLRGLCKSHHSEVTWREVHAR